MSLETLCESLAAAGVPFLTVRLADGVASVAYPEAATRQQRAAGDALAAAWREPTLAEAARDAAKRLASSGDPERVLLRAALRLVLASFAEDRAYLARVRSQVQALGGELPPAPPARTWAQLAAAVAAMIDAGEGDGAAAPTPP